MSTWTGGHTSAVDHLSFSSDGRRMVSGGYDGKVVLWRMGEKTNELAVATLRPVSGSREAPAPAGYRAPNHVAFSPDSAMLAWTVGRDVELWDVPRRTPVFTLLYAGVDPAFSPDGRTLVTATSTGVALWDLATRTRTATLTGDTANTRPGRPAFSLDGRTLAASVGQSIVVWELADRSRSTTLDGAGGTGIAFSPDGSMLAVGDVGSSDIALTLVTHSSSFAPPSAPRFGSSGALCGSGLVPPAGFEPAPPPPEAGSRPALWSLWCPTRALEGSSESTVSTVSCGRVHD
ncbi:MAG: hypothetical protein M3Y48_06700 [Actinomycetota bacterium]|nr:hypothetical protein [Actinomycetota bacterium]